MVKNNKIWWLSFIITGLLFSACKKTDVKTAGYFEVKSFGTNPGNLKMYKYVPEQIFDNSALVVVLHGCSQSAQDLLNYSGWKELADANKFYLLFPEQQSTNNNSSCFNWFEPADANREQGEAKSIVSMVDFMVANFGIKQTKIFVTGFSAGGAMTNVMLATYPDVFSAGAVVSGLPYKAATNLNETVSAMNGTTVFSKGTWTNLVLGQFPKYTGNYPKIAIIHGTQDNVVNFINAKETVKQWTGVQNISTVASDTLSQFHGANDVTRYSYQDNSGIEWVTKYDIKNMGHSFAIDPGTGNTQAGTVSDYTLNVKFSAAYWSAKFFGIVP